MSKLSYKWKRFKKSVFATILCLRFPFLKPYNAKGRFWQTTCWFYSVDEGWRRLALQMFEEIRTSLNKNRQPLSSFHIYDIKQKYGYLIVDCSGGLESEIFKIIQKYEYISFRTCNRCGAPAHGYTLGWILPYCKDCAPDNQPMRVFGTKEDKWYGCYTIFTAKDKEETPTENNLEDEDSD